MPLCVHGCVCLNVTLKRYPIPPTYRVGFQSISFISLCFEKKKKKHITILNHSHLKTRYHQHALQIFKIFLNIFPSHINLPVKLLHIWQISDVWKIVSTKTNLHQHFCDFAFYPHNFVLSLIMVLIILHIIHWWMRGKRR